MRKTLTVRELNEEERDILEVLARTSNPFAERRSRILLASSAGKPPMAIADEQRCDDETVRRVIRDFNTRGLPILIPLSSRAKRTPECFVAGGREGLLDVVRRSPKSYGYKVEDWTLELLADVAYAAGLTTKRVSDETIRKALERQYLKWGPLKRAFRRDRRRIPPLRRSAG